MKRKTNLIKVDSRNETDPEAVKGIKDSVPTYMTSIETPRREDRRRSL
jgi:hypothetical protein